MPLKQHLSLSRVATMGRLLDLIRLSHAPLCTLLLCSAVRVFRPPAGVNVLTAWILLEELLWSPSESSWLCFQLSKR